MPGIDLKKPDVGKWRVSSNFASVPVSIVQGTWSIQGGTNYLGFQAFNSTAAQGDGAAWPIDLTAGTWNLDLLTVKNPAYGIATIDMSFDGGTTWPLAAGTADLYAASAASARVSFTGIVIPVTGRALIRFRALTKNGSSTAYYIPLCGQEWTRTA